MRAAALAVTILAASAAQAQAYFEQVQPLTQTAPTADPTIGATSPATPLSLAQARTLRVVVCAETAGATLSGTGSIRLWVWTPQMGTTGRWSYNPAADLAITVSGSACQSWDLVAGPPVGHIYPATVGVGVSLGTTARLRVNIGTL